MLYTFGKHLDFHLFGIVHSYRVFSSAGGGNLIPSFTSLFSGGNFRMPGMILVPTCPSEANPDYLAELLALNSLLCLNANRDNSPEWPDLVFTKPFVR